MDNILHGKVSEVTAQYTRVQFDEPCEPHLQDQTFIHGSINSVPDALRALGQRVKATYRVSPRYGLWFIEDGNEEPK